MTTHARTWHLPGWTAAPTLAQLEDGGLRLSPGQHWAWFPAAPDTPDLDVPTVGADPTGRLWLRADTPLIRTAHDTDTTPLPVAAACVWRDYSPGHGPGPLSLYLPPAAYEAIALIGCGAAGRGWIPVADVRDQPPEHARSAAWGAKNTAGV